MLSLGFPTALQAGQGQAGIGQTSLLPDLTLLPDLGRQQHLHLRAVLQHPVDSGNLAGHLVALRQACLGIAGEHPELAARLTALATTAYEFAVGMEFGFVYDAERKLLTIGYHPD